MALKPDVTMSIVKSYEAGAVPALALMAVCADIVLGLLERGLDPTR